MEGKIAVFGSTDFVMPFSALGLDTFAVGDAKAEIIERAREIVGGGYALVVVAENIAPAAQEVFVDCENEPTPCIAVVPFTMESTGFGSAALGEVLKLATGINIFANE